MNLQLQPVHIATGSTDTESQLVFQDGFLVAVLVRLSDDHGSQAGMWFLEAGFGQLDLAHHPIFEDLDEARTWIATQMSGSCQLS